MEIGKWEEKRGLNAESAEVGAQSTLRRETQEHSPFGFAQGRQQWLCHVDGRLHGMEKCIARVRRGVLTLRRKGRLTWNYRGSLA
jgi:hypothetical protein